MKRSYFPLLIAITLLMSLSACTKVKKEYYEDGQVKSEITYDKDLKNGPAVWYYPNGNKQMECTFKEDKMEGKVSRWFLGGTLQQEDIYKDNKKTGPTKIYDETGALVAVENFVNDTLHGTYTEFFTNGDLNIHGRFEMGMWDSIWDYYDIRGLQVGKGDFKKGTGILTGYYWNGKVKREIHYLANKKNGVEKWFAEDGTVIKEIIFKEGLVESVITGDTTRVNQSVMQ